VIREASDLVIDDAFEDEASAIVIVESVLEVEDDVLFVTGYYLETGEEFIGYYSSDDVITVKNNEVYG